MKVFYTVAKTTESLAEQFARTKTQQIDRCYVDLGFSCNDRSRPQLNAMLAAVNKGDTVYVPDMSRLSRHPTDALALLNELKAKGVCVKIAF